MTYTVAAGLGALAAVILDLVVLRTRLLTRALFWATYPIIVGFQLIFNGLLTGWGVVRYSPRAIIGVRLASAPVEDLVFGFALVVTTLSLWVWWERLTADRGSSRSVTVPPRSGPVRPAVARSTATVDDSVDSENRPGPPPTS